MNPEDLLALQQQQAAPPPVAQQGALTPQSTPIMPAPGTPLQPQPQMPQVAATPTPGAGNPNPPSPNAMGNIFDTYDPQGAMNNLFAPAYIRGFQPSENAVQDWTKDRRLPSNMIDQTAMPAIWKDPRNVGKSPYKGGQIPLSSNLTGKGTVDPEALRAAAMGGFSYDMAGRRDAIAKRIAENEAAQKAVGWDPNDPKTWVPFGTKKKKEPK